MEGRVEIVNGLFQRCHLVLVLVCVMFCFNYIHTENATKYNTKEVSKHRIRNNNEFSTHAIRKEKMKRENDVHGKVVNLTLDRMQIGRTNDLSSSNLQRMTIISHDGVGRNDNFNESLEKEYRFRRNATYSGYRGNKTYVYWKLINGTFEPLCKYLSLSYFWQ